MAAGASVLVALAAAAAAPFHGLARALLDAPSLGWDAASHALAGLDLYDSLARADLAGAAAAFFGQHWWPPLFGIVLVPVYAVSGAGLASAMWPSFLAFVLTPAAAWLTVRRVAGEHGVFVSLCTLALTGLLFLRSPMLLEMSAWIMFESLGGLLALLAWLFFAARERPGPLKAASALGAALFFLKYHFGFFLLVTFAVVLLTEMPKETRPAVRAALRRLAPPAAALAVGAIATILILARRFSPAFPSVSNVAWACFVVFILRAAWKRTEALSLWRVLPRRVRIFAAFGLLPPALWCLDPANVRAWYRQTLMPPPAGPVGPLAQLAALGRFLADDYAGGLVPGLLVAAGLLAAALRPGGRTRRALAAYVLWPVALLSLSGFRVEERFVGSLVPSLFAAAVAGLADLLGSRSAPARNLSAAVLVAMLAAARLKQERDWPATLAARAPYRYSYPADERAFVLRSVASVRGDGQGPIRVVLPQEPEVAPTVRLLLRLQHRDLAPGDVVVEVGAAR